MVSIDANGFGRATGNGNLTVGRLYVVELGEAVKARVAGEPALLSREGATLLSITHQPYRNLRARSMLSGSALQTAIECIL